MVKIEKNITYYYVDNIGDELKYVCLINNDEDIKILDLLDMKHSRNFSLNYKFKKSPEELKRYRTELSLYNDEICKKWFKNKKEDKLFKINIFKYLNMKDYIYAIANKNCNQELLKTIQPIDAKEFRMLESCICSALMTIDKEYLNKQIDCYGYDFSKFYYHTMRKIKIPIDAPEYKKIPDIDFNKLEYGIYRVKVICDNKKFWNVFNFNNSHHYNSTTLSTLYKNKNKYQIEFKLLEPDEMYAYNYVKYSKLVKLEDLFRQFFNVCDELIKTCSKSNWLLKSLLSTTWGTISGYKKERVHKDKIKELDVYHLSKINQEQETYEYYIYDRIGDRYEIIKSSNAYKYDGLGRIKNCLCEFGRLFIFKFLDKHNLVDNVIRIQTDGIVLNKPFDFEKCGEQYYPIPESKTTGKLIFHNLNNWDEV